MVAQESRAIWMLFLYSASIPTVHKSTSWTMHLYLAEQARCIYRWFWDFTETAWGYFAIDTLKFFFQGWEACYSPLTLITCTGTTSLYGCPLRVHNNEGSNPLLKWNHPVIQSISIGRDLISGAIRLSVVRICYQTYQLRHYWRWTIHGHWKIGVFG